MKRIILFSIILLVSCTKEPVVIEYVKPGCKPLGIHVDPGMPHLSYLDEYIYEGDKPMQFAYYDYEYEGNRVSRINRLPYRYEDYTYDDEDKVISSKAYRRDDENEEFELVRHMEYEYIGNDVTNSRNKLNSLETVYYRNDLTTNIDSLTSFDVSGEVRKTEYFEYDDKPNIYTNVCVPLYHFDDWIIRTTRNNIVRYDRRQSNVEDIWYSADISYNVFNYPEVVTIDFSSGQMRVREIEYFGCE